MQIESLSSSSCKMSYAWDWSKNYSQPKEIYRLSRNYIPDGPGSEFSYGKEMITTQNRVRGKGYSLSIKLEADANKDCKIAGIGVMYSAEQRP